MVTELFKTYNISYSNKKKINILIKYLFFSIFIFMFTDPFLVYLFFFLIYIDREELQQY